MKYILAILFIGLLSWTTAQSTCTDIPPGKDYTCAQQKKWGKCNDSWMVKGNYCEKTCGRCFCGLEGSCVFGICNATKCPTDDCNAQANNIQGKIITLDVNSLSYNAGPNHPPVVTNAADCCDQCKSTQGCNAWVFCSKDGGCGSGCKEYVNSLPDKKQSGTLHPNFGPYGGCQGDKWPWLMCSMKNVSDVNNPKSTASDPNEWISGVIKPSANCKGGLSQAVCDSCNSAKDVDMCYDCVSKVPLKQQMECNMCTGLSTPELQKRCVECLQSDYESGCGQCASLQGDQVEECLKCTLGEDEIAIQNACYQCFSDYSDDGTECVSQCVKSKDVPAGVKSDCGWCYSLASDVSKCTQCLQGQTATPTYCYDCDSEECFSCLAKYPTNEKSRVGCDNCAYQDGDQATECYNCVYDADVPEFSKKQCGFCTQDSSTQSQACYNCLKGANSESAGQACSNCGTYNDDKCYQCVAKMMAAGSDGGNCYMCEGYSAEAVAACFDCMEDTGMPLVVSSQCYMCFGEGMSKAQTCMSCMDKATTEKEAENCYQPVYK